MRCVLLPAASVGLLAGFTAAWDFFAHGLSRGQLLTRFGLATLVWFVCATIWAYSRPRSR